MSTVSKGRNGGGAGNRMAGGTRALLALVIGMGVLIASGTLVVVVTLVHRGLAPSAARAPGATVPGSAPPGAVSLAQPPGSRIASVVATTGGGLALLVSGGGVPDRVLLLDGRDGEPVATIRLERPPAPPP